jgi:hypothetical protein
VGFLSQEKFNFFFSFSEESTLWPLGGIPPGGPRGWFCFPRILFMPFRRQLLVAPWWFFFHQQKVFFFGSFKRKHLAVFFFPPLDETAQWAASGVFLLFSQRHQIENFFKLTISSIMFFCLVFFS